MGRPPQNHQVTLVNHGETPVAFKVLTTDNYAYFVNHVRKNFCSFTKVILAARTVASFRAVADELSAANRRKQLRAHNSFNLRFFFGKRLVPFDLSPRDPHKRLYSLTRSPHFRSGWPKRMTGGGSLQLEQLISQILHVFGVSQL
ncbi:unnamed protein product [Heligmosomoides polygyrus]|uniref:MSP domain-containing protein n=1 Tax=Heligmosomoides polygyrus TaxID=6339 RepID=A0A3P7ZB76_HELPZ|nr:unnamed protein product [Heligmosomoides polygyrus]